MPFTEWSRVGPRNDVLDGAKIPMTKGNIEGKMAGISIDTLCRELCKNGCTDRDEVSRC